MRLIAEGTEDEATDQELRQDAVETYVGLLEKPSLPDVLVKIICWVRVIMMIRAVLMVFRNIIICDIDYHLSRYCNIIEILPHNRWWESMRMC